VPSAPWATPTAVRRSGVWTAAGRSPSRTRLRRSRGRTAAAVREAYASLHHCHVPRLVEAGVVTHDAERNVVALTDRGTRLAGVRDRLCDRPSATLPDR